MYARGLLISCATPAESIPSEASFSDWATRARASVALNELADLAAQTGHHVEGGAVHRPDLMADELEDAEALAPEQDGEGEGGVQTLFRRDQTAWEIGVVADVGDPLRLGTGPGATGEPDAWLQGDLFK